MTIGKTLLLLLNLLFFSYSLADTSPSKVAKDNVPDASLVSVTLKGGDKDAPNTQLLKLGSGAVGGNYFVLGELVGGIISHPYGSLPCGKGGTCGVANLQSQNITSSGSLANLSLLQKGAIQTGFVQSDVAYWAYTGTGVFNNKDKQADVRAIASLYPESMHIIVRKSANIQSVKDLADKRVSVGARKSGTLQGARLVLDAYKISEDDIKAYYLNNQEGMKKLHDEELDAVFFLVGAPAPSLDDFFSQNDGFTLISIAEPESKSIFKKVHYYSPYAIPSNTYPHVREVKTISVYALWLTKESMDEDIVYKMTKALWSETSSLLLNSSYIGKQMSVKDSLNGIGIPLHKGSKRFYNEIGKRF